MKKFWIIIIIVLLLGVFIPKLFIKDKAEVEITQDSATFSGPNLEHQNLVNSMALQEYKAGDETLTVYIKNVYEKDGKIFIDADEFKWFGNGADDADSCVFPSYFPNGAIPSTETRPACGPNGYVIVNENEQIKTYKLSPEVRIRLLEEYGSIPDFNTLSPEEFMNGQDEWGYKFYVSYFDGKTDDPYYPPFTLVLKNGEVLFIHRIYVP